MVHIKTCLHFIYFKRILRSSTVMLLDTQTHCNAKKLPKCFLKIIPGAWIFTSALRVGVTRHLVQAVRDLALASTSSTLSVIAIGITSLRKIQHREILENTKVFFYYSIVWI